MLARPAPDAVAASGRVEAGAVVGDGELPALQESSSTRTATVPAPECLAAFCTASMQQK